MEPLDKPVSGLAVPPTRPVVEGKGVMADTHITILENGLRVASQEAFGQFSTVGGGLGIYQA